MLFGYCKREGRTLAKLRFDKNPTPATFNDFLADSQPDPRTWVFFSGMQAFEREKDFFEIFRFDSDSVVPD
jgi:hypothetical protein